MVYLMKGRMTIRIKHFVPVMAVIGLIVGSGAVASAKEPAHHSQVTKKNHVAHVAKESAAVPGQHVVAILKPGATQQWIGTRTSLARAGFLALLQRSTVRRNSFSR